MEFDFKTTIKELRAKSVQIEPKSDSENRSVHVGALRNEREIWIPPSTPVDFLRMYWHEMGHIISEDLSFKNGEVMTPDQVKNSTLLLDENNREIISDLILITKVDQRITPYLISIGEKILNIFAKGNFDPKSVKLNIDCSQEELDSIVREQIDRVVSAVKDNEGNMKAEYSSAGRNAELGAIATEVGCMWLLENQLKTVQPNRAFMVPESGSPSHDMALRIVARAYKNAATIIPSLKDL